MPAEVLVDLQDRPVLDADGRAMLVVHRIAVGDDRVQTVVAAEPLEHDENLAGLGRRDLARPAEDARHRADAAEQPEPEAAGADAQHVTAGDAVATELSSGHDVRLSCTSVTGSERIAP